MQRQIYPPTQDRVPDRSAPAVIAALQSSASLRFWSIQIPPLNPFCPRRIGGELWEGWNCPPRLPRLSPVSPSRSTAPGVWLVLRRFLMRATRAFPARSARACLPLLCHLFVICNSKLNVFSPPLGSKLAEDRNLGPFIHMSPEADTVPKQTGNSVDGWQMCAFLGLQFFTAEHGFL